MHCSYKKKIRCNALGFVFIKFHRNSNKIKNIKNIDLQLRL